MQIRALGGGCGAGRRLPGSSGSCCDCTNGTFAVGVPTTCCDESMKLPFKLNVRPPGTRNSSWFIVAWIYAFPYVRRSWALFEPSSNPGGMPGLFILKSFILLFILLVYFFPAGIAGTLMNKGARS